MSDAFGVAPPWPEYPNDRGQRVEAGACFFCGTHTEPEDYCYGCHQHVCEACDHRDIDAGCGAHAPQTHLEGADGFARM